MEKLLLSFLFFFLCGSVYRLRLLFVRLCVSTPGTCFALCVAGHIQTHTHTPHKRHNNAVRSRRSTSFHFYYRHVCSSDRTSCSAAWWPACRSWSHSIVWSGCWAFGPTRSRMTFAMSASCVTSSISWRGSYTAHTHKAYRDMMMPRVCYVRGFTFLAHASDRKHGGGGFIFLWFFLCA